MSVNGQPGQPSACPLCGSPLYGWVALPPRTGEASVGEPLPAGTARVLDRCENCGVAAERGRSVDLAEEWRAVGGGAPSFAVPNRAGLQAWIGEGGWAAIDRQQGALLHTPASLAFLARANGHRLEATRTPPSRRAQGWMWQTLLNGLTFHRNFAREVRAGRLRFSDSARLRFAVDVVVTVLGAPLVLLVSAPLELGASLARRGGELVASARPGEQRSQGS